MIFWILVGLLALAVIVVFIGNLSDGEGILWSVWWSIVSAFVGSILGGLVLGVIFVGMAAFSAPSTSTTTHETINPLRSVDTGDSMSGRSFLFSGYVDGKRVLNYAYDNEGAVELGTANANQSRIFENSTEPRLVEQKVDLNYWWFTPWPHSSLQKFEFHVPPNSVVEHFEISTR